MTRDILYGFLGFIIFGIIGILAASALFPTETTSIKANEVVILFAAGGVALSILFAYWMNVRGNQKLEAFSARPKMAFGIQGAVIGGMVSFIIAQYLDPTESLKLWDMAGIIAGIIFFGWLSLCLARKGKLDASYLQLGSALLFGLALFLIIFY